MPSLQKVDAKQPLKTILITGGGGGIGLETARILLEDRQYRLVLLGRNRAKLEEAAHSLGGASDLVSIQVCDLKDSSQIGKMVEKVASHHKGIYGLVNNAGVYPFGGVATTNEAAWDETMTVNLKAPFLLIQAVAPLMAKSPDGGRIVNVSSTAGLLPNHFALAYSVSKAALIHRPARSPRSSAKTTSRSTASARESSAARCTRPTITASRSSRSSTPSAARRSRSDASASPPTSRALSSFSWARIRHG